MGSDRTVVGRALLLFVPGVVAAAVARLALSWDGSYFLVDVLDQGHPVMLHRRPAMLLLQLPAWAGSYATSDTRVLGFLFGLPYVLVPLAALWLSWRVVRDVRPELVVWPALGIGVITLPGQAFFVSESLIAAQFVWPLVLALLVGHRWRWWSLALLEAFLFCLHPMTAMVLGTAAVVAVVVGWRRPHDRPWAWRQGAVLLAVGLVRQVLTSLKIDSEVPKEADIVAQWRHSVRGVPLEAVVLTSLAALALVAAWRWRDRLGSGRATPAAASAVGWAGVAALMAAGGLLVGWAVRLRAWDHALDYRSFVLVFALPVIGLSLVDGLGRDRGASEPRERVGIGAPPAALVVALAGLIFSAVLVAQSAGWRTLTGRLDRAVNRSPAACVLESTLPERHTALRHWATPALALLGQGRHPHRVVVAERAACPRLVEKGSLSVPRTAKLRKPVRHWFDFRRVRDAIRPQLPPTVSE